MTLLQQVLFEMETAYMGHPYYVTGNALYNALARRVDQETRQRLHVSHGVFVPGEYGSYPPAHSKSKGVPYMGTGLRPVETYDDLFLFRDPTHRWLSDTRPRDAHNTHTVQSHGGRQAFAPTRRFGRPPEARAGKRTMKWYVHAYLHCGRSDTDTLPLDEEILDGLRVGGARNYGMGELALTDTQTVDLDALDFSRLHDAADDGYTLELLTPYVLATAYPGADDQPVPWWWGGSDAALRRRQERLVVGGESHAVEVVDHGQVVAYAGSDPVRTAMNGVLRVGSHAKLGFGEFRVRPAGEDRVPERDGLQLRTAVGTDRGDEPASETNPAEAAGRVGAGASDRMDSDAGGS